jgi:hypothetical protein
MRAIPALFLCVIAVAGCGGKRVLVPPRMELAPRAPIGLVTFTVENAQGSLKELATQRFAQHALDAQPGIEVLELGEVPGRIDAAAARALGEEHGLRAVFAGHIVVSDVRPRVSLGRGLRATAEATVTMTVRMLSTETGGTVWTQSARTREAIAAIQILDGGVVFAADDPEEAYGDLVNRLVFRLTHDFRATWQRAERQLTDDGRRTTVLP